MNEKKIVLKLAGTVMLLAILAVSAFMEGKESEDTQEVVVTGQTNEYRSGDDGTHHGRHQGGLTY
ncbi:MAG: hypothetical protein ACQESB_02085 [Elusimicrobiota bacterium]